MLVEDVAAALAPVREAVAPLLGEQWRDIPSFMLFYGLIFFLAIPFWYRVVGAPWPKATLLASCCMSSVHGALCALGAWEELRKWGKFQLDLPNTRGQTVLSEFSLAYMFADGLYYLLPFDHDMLFIVHHFLAGFYVWGCLHTGRAAISSLLMFFLGEVTSPVFNTFTISRVLRHQSKTAAKVFAFASPAFTVCYIVMRSILAPPLVAWHIYSLWFRSPAVPAVWRIPMGGCVLLGIVASQAWTYKLVQGFLKQRRQLKAAKAA